jgi:hypothetical protein
VAVPSLGQITRELNNVYNPQVKLLQDKQAAIPGQIQTEETGLQAKQTQAFDDILGGARRRGLGFAGIPLQEQAKYTSTEFLPALARLRQQGNEQKMSLEEAILGVRERQNNMAYQTREGILSREMAMRQLREQQRQFNESQRAAARASAGGSGFSPTMGAAPSASNQPTVPKGLQTLYNQVFINPKGGSWSDQDLARDYQQTRISAGYGNKRDKQKLELYHSVRPDLFGFR